MSDIRPAGFPDNMVLKQVTIANAASVSEILATQGMALVGVFMDSGWTAAALGFKTCWSGNAADLVTVYDNGGNFEQASAPVASSYVAFPSTDAIFAPFIQVTSRTAGSDTAVVQGAARTLTLVFRKYLN